MKRLPCCLMILLAACGGDDGGPGGSDPEMLAGLYKVDSMTVDNQGCGPGMPATSLPAYLQVKADSLIGFSIYSLQTCQSADVASCGGFFGVPIYEPRTAGGSGYIASAVAAGSSCTLQDAQATFTVTGGALRHEQRTYRQNGTSGTTCTQEEAHRRGATMPCVYYQLTTATRVSP